MSIVDRASRVAVLAACLVALAGCGSRPDRAPEPPPEAAPSAEIDDSAEARALRGEALARQRRYAEAIEVLEQSIAKDDTSARARYWLGFCCLHLERSRDAERHFDRAIAIDPTLPWPYRDRGDLRAAAGRLEAGLADLDRAVTLSVGEASVYERRAHWRLKAGRHADALSDIRAAVGNGATDPSLPLLRWRACDALGRDLEAKYAIEGAVRDLPQTLESHGDDEQWIYDARVTFAAAERYVALIAVLDHVLAARPDDLPALDQRAWAYLRLGRLGDAMADAKRALAIEPGRVYTERLAGGIDYRQGRFAEAMARASRVIDADPRDEPALRLRGQAAVAIGDFAAAQADAERLIAAGHERSGRELLVEVFSAREEWDEALDVLDALLEATPDDIRLLHHRAIVLGGADAYEDALVDIERVFALAGDQATDEARIVQVMCFAGLDRWTDARAAIDAVIKRSPTLAIAYRIRSEIRTAQGDHDGAQEDRDRFVELQLDEEDPDR